MVLWQRTSSIVILTLDISLLPSKILTWTQVFHSARTIGSGDIWHLVVILISPSIPSATEPILPNTTERKLGVAWRIRKLIIQWSKMVSYVLTSSNAWITKKIIKWTTIVVLIGATTSIEISTVKNNRSSWSRVQ